MKDNLEQQDKLEKGIRLKEKGYKELIKKKWRTIPLRLDEIRCARSDEI